VIRLLVVLIAATCCETCKDTPQLAQPAGSMTPGQWNRRGHPGNPGWFSQLGIQISLRILKKKIIEGTSFPYFNEFGTILGNFSKFRIHSDPTWCNLTITKGYQKNRVARRSIAATSATSCDTMATGLFQ
jgi:hypothetical protein